MKAQGTLFCKYIPALPVSIDAYSASSFSLNAGCVTQVHKGFELALGLETRATTLQPAQGAQTS